MPGATPEGDTPPATPDTDAGEAPTPAAPAPTATAPVPDSADDAGTTSAPDEPDHGDTAPAPDDAGTADRAADGDTTSAPDQPANGNTAAGTDELANGGTTAPDLAADGDPAARDDADDAEAAGTADAEAAGTADAGTAATAGTSGDPARNGDPAGDGGGLGRAGVDDGGAGGWAAGRRGAPAAVGAGLLMAAALPPWGWWPLAFVGIALFDRVIADQPLGRRWRRGWLTGIGLYLPSLYWMTDLTLPGYLIASVAYAALIGVAAVAVPARGPGRWAALPGAIALTELLRWSWPFGGVPLSSFAVGQVAAPHAIVLRLGGALLLVELTVIAGVTLAALLRRRWTAAGVGAAAVAALLVVAAFAPQGDDVDGGEIDVALVQGGGRQGTRADETDERKVFEVHEEASQLVETPVDLVVWPEDVVDVEGPVGEAPEGGELADLARQLDAPVVAGVVEGDGPEHFRNASVVFDADGDIVARYDKVHRVPFGEYVPLRSLIEGFAGDSLTDREAVIGDAPAELDTSAGKLAVAISWEIFFADRVREGVERGGEVVLNPTNGSSYRGTLVQTQQVASSRMRAIETGRWVLQTAPTGFTAIIGPDGTVHQRSAVSEQTVLQGTVVRRSGTTPYTRIGLLPAWIVALVSLAVGWSTAWRQRRSDRRRKVAVPPPIEADTPKTRAFAPSQG